MADGKSNIKSNKGFTLIELIVVIAIMSIIVSMSLGGFYMVRKSAVTAATGDIQSQLLKAKGYATSHDQDGTRLRIYVDTDGKLKGTIEYIKDASTGAYKEQFTEAFGKIVSTEFTDSNGTKLVVSQTDQICFTFDKRSGAVTSVTTQNGSPIKTDASTSGEFKIYLTNGRTALPGYVKVYYENGTVE